jgi:hypothetical protein
MALLFCDNFENWTSTNVASYAGPWLFGMGGSGNVNSAIGGVFRADVAGTCILSTGISNTSEVIVNTLVEFTNPSINSERPFLSFYDGATLQTSLRLKLNGKLALDRGLSTNQIVESTNTFQISAGIYYDIELRLNIHNTTGSARLTVNGVEEFNVSGVNTRAGTNNYTNQIWLGPNGSNNAIYSRYKHFILMDTTGSAMNDFIGPVAITSLRPNEDGHYDDWTPNTGNRFAAVNQAITDGDTTYVTANTATDKVSFKLGNLPAGVTDVFGVFAQAQITREAETTRIARMFLRSGVDDEPIGTAQGVGPTYAFRNAAVTVSPFTTNAFDVAEINDIELGMEITT